MEEELKMNEKSAATQMTPESTSIRIVEPETLRERIHQIHDEIERRAYEIFESSEWSWGHDLEHWFKAEAELLHDARVTVSETDDAVIVQAEVPGFTAKELRVSVEPRRLTISGQHQTSKEEKKKGTTISDETRSSGLLRVVDFPADVDAANTSSTLKNGTLILHLPKIAAANASAAEV
jgi:HSP20 family protein